MWQNIEKKIFRKKSFVETKFWEENNLRQTFLDHFFIISCTISQKTVTFVLLWVFIGRTKIVRKTNWGKECEEKNVRKRNCEKNKLRKKMCEKKLRKMFSVKDILRKKFGGKKIVEKIERKKIDKKIVLKKDWGKIW